MPCKLLKINMPLSFVMRRSPVRVREVAQNVIKSDEKSVKRCK